MPGVRLQVTAQHLLPVFLCLPALSAVIAGHEGGGKVVTSEGSDVILPCSLSTNQNIDSGVFDWTKDAQRDEPRKEVFFYEAGHHYNNKGRSGQSVEFKGRVFHFPDELNHGNASITIRRTTMNDRGSYTCFFPRLQTPQRFQVELVVGRDPQRSSLKNKHGEVDGASSEPYVSMVDFTKGVTLKCEVRGVFPEPKLQWQHSDGTPLPAEETRVSLRGRRYDATLETTVTATATATNRFSCVATQEGIGHSIAADITVPEKLFEDSCSKVDLIGWSIGGLFIGASAVLAVLALLVAKKFITISRNKGSGSYL